MSMTGWTPPQLDAIDGADELDGVDAAWYRLDNDLNDNLDLACRRKYGRYPGPTASITAAAARETTVRIDPA